LLFILIYLFLFFFFYFFFFFSSRRRHTRSDRDWSSDVCSSDLQLLVTLRRDPAGHRGGPIQQARGARLPAGRAATVTIVGPGLRSEERRVGKECRSRWAGYH